MTATVKDADTNYKDGWDDGMEQAATWHDERERLMREAAINADPDLKMKCVERASWHRDCAAALRDMTE